MDKIGLISSLSLKLNASYESHVKSENTFEQKLNNTDIKETAELISKIGSVKDLNSLITAERIILRHESQYYGKNHIKALNSLNQAILELDVAAKTLDIVRDKDKYQVVSDTCPLKNFTKTGLPKDAFHAFTNSHKTRLENRMRSIEASFEERLLLKERYNNMQIAQKEYMGLQALALNIKLSK